MRTGEGEASRHSIAAICGCNDSFALSGSSGTNEKGAVLSDRALSLFRA
jgi:hypothetical protein